MQGSVVHLTHWNQGSEKAWKLLNSPDASFKLGLAVAILPAAEEVILQQFRWQSENCYLDAAISDTPLVIMADMGRSPTAVAIDILVKGLVRDTVAVGSELATSRVQALLHLHQGGVDIWFVVFVHTLCMNLWIANFINFVLELIPNRPNLINTITITVIVHKVMWWLMWLMVLWKSNWFMYSEFMYTLCTGSQGSFVFSWIET